MGSAAADVVVPTLGRPSLSEAVESALRQEPPPARVIVVDDSGGEAARRLGTLAGVVEVVRGPRRGPGPARNAGLAVATSPLVAFLDDDDLWLPGRLGETTRALEANPGAVLAACDAFVPGGGYLDRFPGLPRGGGAVAHPFLLLVERGSFLCTSAVVGRREALLAAGGFAEDLSQAEDYALWLRMAASSGGVALVDEPLVRYRPGPTSISRDELEAAICARVAVERAFAASGRRGEAALGRAVAARRAALLATEARLRAAAGKEGAVGAALASIWARPGRAGLRALLRGAFASLGGRC